MRKFIRTAAVAGVLGATALLAVPAASATPTATGTTGQAAPECVTDSQTYEYGRGEIKVCVENGQARMTGWVEDLLPQVGWWGGRDGACVLWWVTFRTTSGTEREGSVMACPHLAGPAYKEFDFTSDVQNITGIEKMSLTTSVF
ncbi:hypothetical protein AB0I75_09415 [Streptomyces sp. NPDC050273]|uniref:hypothetical protein n=1 Tax=Streptomyces sp. NPDC050273 TaxID=3154933 RepID=UPI00341C82E1